MMFRWLAIGLCALCSCTTEPECDTNADCDDGDVCTEDRCRLELCSNLATTFCCHDQRPCTDPDAQTCDMDASPDPDAGRCVACVGDGDCDDPFPWCWHRPLVEGGPLCVECITDGHCQANEACLSFACVPRGPPPPGAPCTQDSDCASNWCLREADTGFPGGLCGQPCNDHPDCATGLCVDAAGAGKTCLGPCLTPPNCPPDTYCPPECRPEYMCNGQACVPHCTDPGHCPAVGTCDPWSGMCSTTPPPGAPNGAACTNDVDCRGVCATEATSGAPGGLCVSFCSDARRACPDADLCAYLIGPFAEAATVCLPEFDPGIGCREAWAPQIAGLLPTDTPEWGAAPVCLPACQDADCQSGVCNEYSGVCNAEPDPTRGDTGDPCQSNADCKGMCMFLWPAGYCMGPCILGGPACQDGEVCMNLGILTSCGHFCDDDTDCRLADGYACNTTLQACLPP